MKELKILFLVFAILIAGKSYSQSVDEILRNARVLRQDDKIFIEFEKDNSMQSYVGRGNKGKSSNMLPFDKNHAYYLIKNSGVNIYMRPVNPLNYSVDAQIKYSVDSSIIKVNAALSAFQKAFSTNKSDSEKGADDDCDSTAVANATAAISKIKKQVQIGQNKPMVEIFNGLKGLSFEYQEQTASGLKDLKSNIDQLSKYYHNMDSIISKSYENVKGMKCADYVNLNLLQNSFTSQLDAITLLEKSQKSKLANLLKAYSLAKAVYDQAAGVKDETISWRIRLTQPDIQDDKITDVTLTLNKSGFELTSDSDFVATKSSSVSTYTFHLKKFNHFVPEIAAGIVYTNLQYDTYGTGTDATGNTIITDTKNAASKFSVTTMFNLNYYIPNSYIHPFLQAGIGTSTDYQALFLGLGLRSQYLHGITFSVGGASPWLKSLKTLKIGDKVSGTTQINNDLSSDISWFRKIYFGIQLKL